MIAPFRSATAIVVALAASAAAQSQAPTERVAFEDAVNVTLGLPIVRTSVDHGTAFDIAWKGVADVSSLIHAVTLAAKLTARPPV